MDSRMKPAPDITEPMIARGFTPILDTSLPVIGAKTSMPMANGTSDIPVYRIDFPYPEGLGSSNLYVRACIARNMPMPDMERTMFATITFR